MINNFLQLYIHIPFCVRKCSYCDFLSFPADDEARAEYVDALLREIRAAGAVYSEYKISSVYIGGGTPSLLSPEQIGQLGTALSSAFGAFEKNCEFSVECNPGTVTQEKLRAFKAAGINRLSIGLQSMNDKELRALGRIHTSADFLNTYDAARAAGFENINIDLMQAVPYQTPASWKKTLEAAAALEPEHISAYSLIIEEGTPFYEAAAAGMLPQLPDEDEEREIYYATRDILEKYGYKRYEISNYALPGFECRHNIGYWKRENYLGLGLGASSLIENVRWKNTADISKYIKCNTDEGFMQLRTEEEVLTHKAQMEEFMFLGLRLTKGISKREFRSAFGIEYDSVYGTVSQDLEKKGLLAALDDRVFLTDLGVYLSNTAMAEFLLD